MTAVRPRVLAVIFAFGSAWVPATARATCVQATPTRVVCSAPGGPSYSYRVKPPPRKPRDRPQSDWLNYREGQERRLHLEAGFAPAGWIPLDPALRPGYAVGGDAFVRGLYGWRRPRDMLGAVLAGFAMVFFGNQFGPELSVGLGAVHGGEPWDQAVRLHLRSNHRWAVRRFTFPALLGGLPAVGLVSQVGQPVELDLQIAPPIGVMITPRLGLELRSGMYLRRPARDDGYTGATVSLALVIVPAQRP